VAPSSEPRTLVPILAVLVTALLPVGVVLMRDPAGREARIAAPERGASVGRSVPSSVRAPVVASTPPEELLPAVQRGTPVVPEAPDPATAAGWERCLTERDAELLRLCLEAELAAGDVVPELFADRVCRAEPVGRARTVCARAGLSFSDPREVPRRVVTLATRCALLAGALPGAVDELATADPVWLARVVAALDPADAFREGAGLALLVALDRSAKGGDAATRRSLEEGGRGALGGGDEQVAWALARAAHLQADAPERLGYLRSVASSPSFGGRVLETRAWVGALLDPASMGDDPEPALTMLHDALADPHLGPRTAREVLVLAEADSLAQSCSEAERLRMVDAARLAIADGSRR